MLKELRRKYRYPQHEFAYNCRFSCAKLSKIEHGTQLPSAEDIETLIANFKIIGATEEEIEKLKTIKTRDLNWRADGHKARKEFDDYCKQLTNQPS